jgi:hypothetical protein
MLGFSRHLKIFSIFVKIVLNNKKEILNKTYDYLVVNKKIKSYLFISLSTFVLKQKWAKIQDFIKMPKNWVAWLNKN